MPTRKSPRKGSLQFWPRKRAEKFLPSTNWDAINSDKPLKGFICYKAGMASAAVKDLTPHSMSKDKKIIVPVTILECPPIKIFSARFYKDGKVATDILSEGADKELKKVLKLPKKTRKMEDVEKESYDDLRMIVYSVVKKTGLKKTPEITEIGLNGTIEEKFKFIKDNLGKEISILNFFEKGQLVDLRGLTKGKGLQGPVKRFGITLKAHKSEKGVRRPGSLGPWHPARVTFRVPMAGQLGMFTRTVYNNRIMDMGKGDKKFKNIKNYGNVNSDYVIVQGSVQGPAKRQLVLTQALRETKKQKKKEYEFIELR
ncbi:50S ribosomal protein L3 [Candidatus Pacearchaeota archaeon CG1_02_30_18]|nr:50S ribosomal protein L3 [Candidatus Pacearchaeota archaeon]OIO40792.1 MAG: 50S ribosomal protein L3 [Candidatus Pacearchaeota archaeon CG1_02_30_18]PIN71674.1 MAG: 50S ribosomal protein L3 [Candidatus Pacearchaeota archaeon CG11_big_fil_rev_8_21_14_0_20_30_13]PIZ82199.1 MAG: 50S ribosomal protein L3 [Candidatus Pacearchaeota archaeon CG_4_10_14_0_2_um_filter_30_11]PJA71692.1 MAG: 50S ribosomal protein L3 [Candidatus Pacearchaeota archaeon CG_4_9_14_3_um_filter_30_11]